MVIGIIVLHLPQYQPLSDVGSLFEFVKAFFSHGIFRATVPVLTVISGYLVFCYNLHLQPRTLVLKKLKTVLIPLFIWNIPFAIGIFLSQKYALISHNFSAQLHPFQIESWINALFGLFDTPANYPLNFLRDLFAISLLAPLLGFLLNRIPYLGLVLVLFVYFFNLDGYLVLRNSMLVSFYIGGLAAVRAWDLTALDNYAKPLFWSFLTFSAVIVLFKIENRELFRLVSPFMVWPAISLLEKTKVYDLLHKYSENSFFTFLAHGPIILVLWFLFSMLPNDIPYVIYWILAPVITVFICIILATYFKRMLPTIASVVLGGR